MTAARGTHAMDRARMSHRLDVRENRAITQYLWVSDLVVIGGSIFAAQLMRMGEEAWATQAGQGSLTLDYTWISLGLVVAWMTMLSISGARDFSLLGHGSEEFAKVLTASMWTLALLSVFSFAFRMGVARGYVALAIPLGTVLLLVSRWAWRRWLVRRREDGRMCARLLAVGPNSELAPIRQHLRNNHGAGYMIVGQHETVRDADALELESIALQATEVGADSVLITASAGLDNAALRDLMWLLADGDRGLVVASSLTGISGPRASSRPVDGLPLWQVEPATYSGGMWLIKEAFDRVAAFAALVILLPVLLVVALAIRIDSPGPVIFKQRRVGVNGEQFRIWKFRSMRQGADAELMALLAQQSADGKPLFKPENDPRITRLGRFIRKYSIDELPQLVNVLKGDMSIVGPRPQRPEEVALYDHVATHRLKTKPGITGLWQVSGRSDIEWEEAVLLDLYYVENWSIALDLSIIARTVRVVLKGDGAR